MQNEPVNPRDCYFNPGEMHYWDDKFGTEQELLSSLEGHCDIFGACDPSMGKQTKRGDYSAILSAAIDYNTGIIYILDADIAKRFPDKTIEDILAYHQTRKYYQFGFETNQFQEFMANELQKRAQVSGRYLNIEQIKHTTDKLARIQGIQPFVKNGTIQFSRRHIVLLEQMKFFPKGNHDDGLDALEMVFSLCKTGGHPDYKQALQDVLDGPCCEAYYADWGTGINLRDKDW